MRDNLFLVRIEYTRRTEPPNGLPRVLAEMCVEHANLESANKQLIEATGCTPGCSYSPSYQHLPPPAKTRSKETLARMRRGRVARRMEQKFPLFAEQFTDEQITANTDYYIDGNSPYDQEKATILDEERQRFEHFSANIGRPFIYRTLNKEM